MINTVNPSQPYSERLLRRLVPFIASVITVAALITIANIVLTQLAALQTVHTNTVNRAASDISAELDPLVSATLNIADDARLKNFVRSEGTTLDATNRAVDMIDEFPTTVQSIRYITDTGIIRMEVQNINGFPQITVPVRLDSYEPQEQESAFYDALNTRQGVTFGVFLRQRNRDSNAVIQPARATLALYVPVVLDSQEIHGAVQIVIDATALLNIVNRAETTFLDPLRDRHALFVAKNNLVVADNNAPNQDYLNSLEASQGNLTVDGFYKNLTSLFAETQNTDYTARWGGLNIISSKPLVINNANDVPWRLFLVDNLFVAYASGFTSVLIIILGAVTLGIFSGVLVRAIIVPMLEPVETASILVTELVRDNAPANTLDGNPELSLVETLEQVAHQLTDLNRNFQEQVKRRNRDLKVMGRIGYETAVLEDLDTLLKRSINLICNEMGFYHAQIFLDDIERVARLVVSRGEAGQEMLARGHKIAIGSPTVIGTVTAQRRPVILNNVADDQNEVKHGFNPLLPDTKAEMALPLIIGDQLIGALDIQSIHPNVFLVDDLPTFELLANQVAVAIHNTQLKTQSDRRIEQIDRLNRQLTRSAWQETAQAFQIEPQYGDVNPQAPDKVEAHIMIRGESIGAIEATLPDGQGFTEGDQVVLQAVAERVAIAIENARLFQQTQVSLAETYVLYQVSQQLNEATSLDDILQSIINTVATEASGAQLWLFDDYSYGAMPTLVRLQADLATKPRQNTLQTIVGRAYSIENYGFVTQLSTTKATYVADITNARAEKDLVDTFWRLGVRTLIIVPLNMRGVWKGFVTVNFDVPHPFGEREQRLYDALVAQAGVAIDNRLLLQQTEEALSRNEKLYSASRLINTTRNFQDLVYAAVATTSDLSLNFWLGLLEGEADMTGWRDRVRIVAKSDAGNVRETDIALPLIVDASSPLRLREPEILSENDSQLPEYAQRRLHDQQLGFMAIFPLYVENLPIALFYIVSDHPHALSGDDYEVYKALTGQMSTQIQNRRLLTQTETALNDATRLYVASRAISSVQDTPSLYSTITGHLATPFAQSTGNSPISLTLTILLARPEPLRDAPELEYVYQWSSDTSFIPSLRVGTFINHNDVPLGNMLENSDDGILVYNNLSAVRDGALKAVLRQDKAMAAAVAPIQVRQMWFGALIVHTDKPDMLTDNYIRFMQAIADQVAVALENQNLLQDAQNERANLNNILSTLPAGVLVLHPETLVPMQINERIQELLGREIDFTQPFSAKAYKLFRTGTQVPYPDEELPFYTANQLDRAMFADDVSVIDTFMHVDLLVNAAPIYDNNGRKAAIVTAFQDISNLRSLENTLQENLQETVALYESQRALSEAETLDDLLDTILAQLMLQQTSDVHIVLADERSGNLTLGRYLVNPLSHLELLRPILRPDFVIVDDVLETDEMDSACRQVFEDLGMGSVMVMPLRAKTRALPLGWLILSDTSTHTFTSDQERMLGTLADMATTAIDNNYLVQSTQIALQETDSLYRASATINRSKDIEDLAAAIQFAMATMQGDFYAAYLVKEISGIDPLFVDRFENHLGEADLLKLLFADLSSEDGVFISNFENVPNGNFEREALKMHDVKAIAAVNLRVKDMSGGRLFVGYRQPHDFNEGDVRFLNTISDSTSVVIDNIFLLDQIQSTLRETSVLYQASRALTNVTKPSEIVEVVVSYLAEDHISQIFVGILTRPNWQSPAAELFIESSWQPDGIMNLQGIALSQETFPAWQELAGETVRIIRDIHTDASLNEWEKQAFESLDVRSLVIIPLRVSNRPIGIIWMASQEAHEYEDSEERIFQSMGEQTSLTLEATRLLEQTEKRATQLQTTAQISERVGQILDLEVLLPQVVTLIRDRFGYDHVQVFLMDENDDWALLKASTGEAGSKLLDNNHKLQKGSQSVIGRVTANNQVTIALDTTDANVVHKPNPLLPLTRSEMAIPLSIKGQVVGALDVQSNKPNAFAEEDIQTLSTLASQIAIAIENARLYEETQGRANELGFLFDITTAATAADTLQGVLQSIIERLYEALDPLAVAIYLPQSYEDINRNKRIMLKPSALAGINQPISELSEVKLGDAENLIGIVGSTLQSQIVPNIEKEVRYVAIATDAKSAIVVPIGSGAELVGLLVMEANTLNAYNHDTLTLLLTLAGSLSAVIQNTLLLERLQKTNDQLREVDRLKSQFLANMSHELRTPLNSIIGFSRVMLKGIDGPLTEMQEQDLNTIYNSGNHLLNLINDILDQAKIEAKEMQLKFTYFDVKPMVESVKSIAIGLLKDKPLQLYVEVAPNLPQAYGDEFRSRQILLNLMSNAIKFTQEGGVTIRVYQNMDMDGITYIRADVIDTGIGIEEKDMPILFEQFRQVDNSLTRTVGGTGLGLPISRSLAELQGGQLLVSSIVGTGSTFSVLIPTAPDPASVKQEDSTESRRATNGNNPDTDTGIMKRPKEIRDTQSASKIEIPIMPVKRDVLLIEDNKDMVDQFRRALQREGFEVQTADHPSYAEAMVGQLRPTVVIMDVNFANGEGWNILKNLKKREDTLDVPIIITTLSGEKDRALEHGANRFLQRPFMPDQLVATVLELEKENSLQRILIIDDQPEALRLLKQLLDEHGSYRIFIAESGKEGISMVARRRPDLVILDLRMPDMDGFQVLQELRANPETANIPVMVVTGDIHLENTEHEQLQNIRVLQKTDISAEEYNTFINEIKNELKNR
jgi:GAF domain-containing protein/DNA-binding response OmpR family regulator